MAKSKDGSPFKCDVCGDRDKENRNCLNRKGLSEAARAVTEYTDEVNEEHKESGAAKVFPLGDIRLYECPLTYLTEETLEISRLVYLIEDTKVLLYAGGWGDQPMWLIEAFEIYKIEAARSFKDGRR